MTSIAIASDHTLPKPATSARQFDQATLGPERSLATSRHPERYSELMAVTGGILSGARQGSTGCRWSAYFVDLLAALLEEAADRAGEPGDHGDRVDLHEHIEDSSSDGNRVLDLRGNRQLLSRRPRGGVCAGTSQTPISQSKS